jgi:hypothetical protein
MPKTGRNTFVAKPGQTLPDDPKFQEQGLEEIKEDSQSGKKANVNLSKAIDEYFEDAMLFS